LPATKFVAIRRSAALNDRFTAQKFARAATKQRLAKLFASPAL